MGNVLPIFIFGYLVDMYLGNDKLSPHHKVRILQPPTTEERRMPISKDTKNLQGPTGDVKQIMQNCLVMARHPVQLSNTLEEGKWQSNHSTGKRSEMRSHCHKLFPIIS